MHTLDPWQLHAPVPCIDTAAMSVLTQVPKDKLKVGILGATGESFGIHVVATL